MPTADATSSISGNTQVVMERIAAAASRSGRRGDEVTLLAATKTVAPALLREAAAAGISTMGENRIQEALAKIPPLADLNIDWQFIGHLQTNKARQAVRLFPTIQSVDSIELARHVDRVARDEGKCVRVLLEINTSGEPSKHGFAPTEVERAALDIQSMPALEIDGLMTIGPLTDDAHETRQAFRLLKGLQDQLAARYTDTGWDTLSMGMTDDFEIAVEEGATLVRVGRAIFGPRS